MCKAIFIPSSTVSRPSNRAIEVWTQGVAAADARLAYDRYPQDPRSIPYHQHITGQLRPGGLAGGPSQNYNSQHVPRDIPRFEPSIPRLTIPQVLGHSPSSGGAGTSFTVQVTDISNDPRTYKFVFGSKRVGAFLERAHSDGNTSLLAAQVPRFKDCDWWSDRVPVYLVIADSQTDAVIHQAQICEFLYDDSPSPRKRARDEIVSGPGATHLGSPIKRPNSQPTQVAGKMASYPAPPLISAFQSPYSQEPPQRTGQHPGQGYRDFPQSMPIPFSNVPPLGSNFGVSRSAPLGRDFPVSHSVAPSPLSIPDQGQTRYVAEPQDQYQHRISGGYGEPPISNTRSSHISSEETPSFYQGSVVSSSSPTWKSPQRADSSHAYTATPPSASIVKDEPSYDPTDPPEEAADPHAPMLQRTSTLSSSHGSGGPSAATPVSNPATWLPANKARLEVLGNLDDMSRNWSAEEFAIRRRLVQFWRKQEGSVIKINFRPVEPGVSRPPHAVVISCIYWEEQQECFFTSVDAIFLLESLVGNKFAVEEKNRIRRNLEGFRPLTVSKGKADSESFFRLIMSFPAPKPRNIEKDVKAFPWRILTSALRKIVGKYSASYDGLTECAGVHSNEATDAHTPTPGSADMPPPVLSRDLTTDSRSSQEATPTTTQMQPTGPAARPQQQQQQYRPRQSGHGLELPPPHLLNSESQPLGRPSTSSPRGMFGGGGLSIQVPQQSAEGLPVLDSSIASATQLERRPSVGVGFPLSGISNVDFSDFFQSPGNQPSSNSGWPSLNSLFPPPSAGLGPDQPPPRKH